MNIEQLKNLLKRHHIHPNKTFGQNFLLNDVALRDMVDSVPLKKDDALLEVGPGIGNLTKLLLERADFVLAVEKDKNFLPVLKALKKDHKNLRYEIADILTFDFQKALAELSFPTRACLGEAEASRDRRRESKNFESGSPIESGMTVNYHVVANIPYYITGKIIQLFVRAKHKPKTITLLLQKEVARNIVAKPGQLNLLAISVQIYGQPKILFEVPARDFYPEPKVDSAALQIKLSERPLYDIGDEKKFFRILRACFAGKRKQIHNTLRNNLKLEKAAVEKILKSAGVNAAARPQELAIEQWVELVKAVNL